MQTPRFPRYITRIRFRSPAVPMEPIECLHCKQPTLTYKDQLKATHWVNIACPQCGGRMAAQPWLMLALWFTYMWDVFFFGFMAFYEDGLFYGAALVIGWLLLEYFGYYIPLVRLRRKQPKP